jgi:hypothetical protein
VSGAEETEYKWTFGVRWIADQIDRATWRNTLTYQFHPRFRAGLEYNPLADDVSALANALVVTETEFRPAVILGTSSDRIGTPEGEAFYGTVSKDVSEWVKLPLAPYAGVSFGTFEDRWRPIAGLKVSFTERLDSTVLFDGVRVHPTLNYSVGRHVFGIILVGGKDPGASYSISF